MYSETSVNLKTDFYCRYGQASGRLWFERAGCPCVLLRGKTKQLAFALNCGVRAYGRKYGDVLRILDADSNVCDARFSGSGAQILYKKDVSSLHGMNDTIEYTIKKLLLKMGIGTIKKHRATLTELCDRYGSGGWCAYSDNGVTKSIPLPIYAYNVLIVRTRKNSRIELRDGIRQFSDGEDDRAEAAAQALKVCREDVLFDMINESERSIERLLSPSKYALSAVIAAREAEGATAARICDSGVVCFVEKERTDSAIRSISADYEHMTGCSVDIIVAG